jgi:pyruvate/oxaloacetate carboxyltransferase
MSKMASLAAAAKEGADMIDLVERALSDARSKNA